jgi:hypothetical protein
MMKFQVRARHSGKWFSHYVENPEGVLRAVATEMQAGATEVRVTLAGNAEVIEFKTEHDKRVGG